jgi:hypothetical protein
VAPHTCRQTAYRLNESEIFLRTPEGGIYRCQNAAFGALIGDRTQTDNNISLGPGVAMAATVASPAVSSWRDEPSPRTT